MAINHFLTRRMQVMPYRPRLMPPFFAAVRIGGKEIIGLSFSWGFADK
jgi:hypothetical protein